MNILVLNGPNLNLLGIREPSVYGVDTYDALVSRVTAHGRSRGVTVRFYQSNHEGALVDAIQAARGVHDGLVINPAAYTHTSIALLDALLATALPAVEVHLTDISRREPFRRVSYVQRACIATIAGKGVQGYCDALDLLLKTLRPDSP